MPITENPGILLTILAFALVIGPLVFIHELGHYFVGRWFGVHAEAFSIGFGREIKGWTDKRGTRWKLAWLPLGGYVRFAGDMSPASEPSREWLALPEAERARTFQAKPVWQRALIVAAGPAINFLFAILVLMGFAISSGELKTPSVIAAVVAGSPAEQAGLVAGDRIVSISGRKIDGFDDLARFTSLRPDEDVVVSFEREGAILQRALRLGSETRVDEFGNEARVGLLGVAPGAIEFAPVALVDAPGTALRQTGQIVQDMFTAIGQIVTGRRSMKELGGPLKIAEISGQQVTLGLAPFIFFVALISINLGFINLLPVPMLDGGHLLFYAIEAVRRKPVSIVAQEWAFRSGLLVLLTLMIFVTFNDLSSFGVWESLSGLIG